ncbi:MAG: hypothetical protein ACE5FH_11815, partial [Candidatus Zixiibacteriota bacterium]
MTLTRLASIGMTALIIATLAGCGSDSTPPTSLAPFQPEIVNNPDAFSLQATDVKNVSAQVIYTWQNSGTQATIDHSTALTGGTASVSIFDSVDSLVYTQG